MIHNFTDWTSVNDFSVAKKDKFVKVRDGLGGRLKQGHNHGDVLNSTNHAESLRDIVRSGSFLIPNCEIPNQTFTIKLTVQTSADLVARNHGRPHTKHFCHSNAFLLASTDTSYSILTTQTM